MTDVRQDSSNEKRRRLLKGALGASTVVTLGYGGSVAAASISCVEKVDGGFPWPENQFFEGDTPPSSTSSLWAWKKVDIRRYKENGNGTNIDGFEVGDKVYRTVVPHLEITSPSLQSNGGNNYPKTGWVLVYFDYEGNETGTYPELSDKAQGYAPAAESCLASINPDIRGNYTYGG